MLKCAIAIAAFVAFVEVTQAYVQSDICDVVVKVTYDTGNILGFTISDQDTTGSAQLQPGTFTIGIEGKLCSDGVTVGYSGVSSSQTITGAETDPITISIVALDQQTYGSQLDSSVDAQPIIVSVSVSPAIIRIGEQTELSFTAIDPVQGVDPTSYSLAMTSPGGNGTFDNGKACGAGTSCALRYTAGLGDSGNIPFTMTVEDAGANTDSVSGFLAIDSTGTVNFNVQNFHIPEMGTPTTVNEKVAYGSAGLITVPVTDVDLNSTVVSDTVSLEFTISEIQSLTEGTQQAIGCDAADVSVESTVAGDLQTFEVTWAPWGGNANNAAFYGETWCKFELTARDAAPGGGLISQTKVFTMAAIGTPATGGGFGQLPVFSLLFVEDSTPVVGQTISLVLTYADADSTSTLTIDDGGLSASSTYGPFANENCTVIPCTRTITLDTDGAPGSHVVTVTLTDDDNSNLVDSRQLVVTSSSARRHRRSGSRQSGTYQTSLSITNGKLNAEVDRNGGGGAGPGQITHHSGSSATEGSSGSGSGVNPSAIAGLIAAICIMVFAVGAVVARRSLRPPATTAAKMATRATEDDTRSQAGDSRVVMVDDPEFESLSSV